MNSIEIKVGNYILDLLPKERLRLELNSAIFQDTLTDAGYTFTTNLPRSANNVQALNLFTVIESNDINKIVPIQFFENNVLRYTGTLTVQTVHADVIACYLLVGESIFINDFQNLYLHDLDLGGDRTLNVTLQKWVILQWYGPDSSSEIFISVNGVELTGGDSGSSMASIVDAWNSSDDSITTNVTASVISSNQIKLTVTPSTTILPGLQPFDYSGMLTTEYTWSVVSEFDYDGYPTAAVAAALALTNLDPIDDPDEFCCVFDTILFQQSSAPTPGPSGWANYMYNGVYVANIAALIDGLYDLTFRFSLVPQIYDLYLIKKMFATQGYTVAGDILTGEYAYSLTHTNYALDQVVTLPPSRGYQPAYNAYASTFNLIYAVPEMTCYDFLEDIKKRFNMIVQCDSINKVATFKLITPIVDSPAIVDITTKCDPNYEFDANDFQGVNLQFDFGNDSLANSLLPTILDPNNTQYQQAVIEQGQLLNTGIIVLPPVNKLIDRPDLSVPGYTTSSLYVIYVKSVNQYFIWSTTSGTYIYQNSFSFGGTAGQIWNFLNKTFTSLFGGNNIQNTFSFTVTASTWTLFAECLYNKLTPLNPQNYFNNPSNTLTYNPQTITVAAPLFKYKTDGAFPFPTSAPYQFRPLLVPQIGQNMNSAANSYLNIGSNTSVDLRKAFHRGIVATPALEGIDADHYPYAGTSQIQWNEENDYELACSLNEAETGNMYDTAYADFINLQSNMKTMRCLVNLTVADKMNLSLYQKYQVRNNNFLINKISDMLPSDGPVQIEFYKC